MPEFQRAFMRALQPDQGFKTSINIGSEIASSGISIAHFHTFPIAAQKEFLVSWTSRNISPRAFTGLFLFDNEPTAWLHRLGL